MTWGYMPLPEQVLASKQLTSLQTVRLHVPVLRINAFHIVCDQGGV